MARSEGRPVLSAGKDRAQRGADLVGLGGDDEHVDIEPIRSRDRDIPDAKALRPDRVLAGDAGHQQAFPREDIDAVRPNQDRGLDPQDNRMRREGQSDRAATENSNPEAHRPPLPEVNGDRIQLRGASPRAAVRPARTQDAARIRGRWGP